MMKHATILYSERVLCRGGEIGPGGVELAWDIPHRNGTTADCIHRRITQVYSLTYRGWIMISKTLTSRIPVEQNIMFGLSCEQHNSLRFSMSLTIYADVHDDIDSALHYSHSGKRIRINFTSE